jgi:hypothetical protein
MDESRRGDRLRLHREPKPLISDHLLPLRGSSWITARSVAAARLVVDHRQIRRRCAARRGSPPDPGLTPRAIHLSRLRRSLATVLDITTQ